MKLVRVFAAAALACAGLCAALALTACGPSTSGNAAGNNAAASNAAAANAAASNNAAADAPADQAALEQKAAAALFATAWLNQWDFADGQMTIHNNSDVYFDSYMALVEPGSDADTNLRAARAGYPDKLDGISAAYTQGLGAATHVAGVTIVAHEGNVVTLDVATFATQNTVDQSMWDTFVNRGPSMTTFAITLNDDNLVTKVEFGDEITKNTTLGSK